MPRVTPAHYLRPNEAEWTPAAVAFIDTETYRVPNTEPEVLAMRLWCARTVDRRPNRNGRASDTWAYGTSRADIAAWVEKTVVGRDSLWLYAHNLAFDLVTTRLPLLLVESGWAITEAALSGRAPWLRFSRGRKHITMADSWSWLPHALADIGTAVGVAKPALPDDDGTDVAWQQRCRADVEILSAAMLGLMDWWDHDRLGRWTISGPASGWNAMRHKPTVERIVVDPRPDLVSFERQAVYGGRRGTWRIGTFGAGPFAEVDFTAAYPTVAAELPLPLKRSHSFDHLALDDFRLRGDRWGVIAEVEVETDTARWPVRTDGGVFYPVGRFTTTLAGPDITEALRLGCLRSVRSGWAYRLGRALTPWARWCLSVQSGQCDTAPPIAVMVAKSWGRTVIGKWAMRSSVTTKWGPSPFRDWHIEEGWDHSGGCKGTVVDLAGQRFWTTRTETGDNCFPAVLAFVEAHVRTRLNRALEALGGPCLLQCDTDGVIIDTRRVSATTGATGHAVARAASPAHRLQRRLDEIAPQLAPLSLRVKRVHDQVAIIGPQHVMAGGQRRFAGLPTAAQQIGPGRYRVRLWPSLSWQLSNGDARGFVRPLVEPVVTGPFPTGWLLADGRVTPVSMRARADGPAVIDMPPAWVGAGGRPGLHDAQHPRLAGVLTGTPCAAKPQLGWTENPTE